MIFGSSALGSLLGSSNGSLLSNRDGSSDQSSKIEIEDDDSIASVPSLVHRGSGGFDNEDDNDSIASVSSLVHRRSTK